MTAVIGSLHTPERLADESVDDYRARRVLSRATVERMTLANIGDQRKVPSSRESLRDAQRKNGALRGIYGLGLQNHFNRKRRADMAERKSKKANRS